MSRKLDNWIKTYMQYTSYNESPDKFHFWTSVVTIAGALRRQVWIDCTYWDWVANFYVILVAPPGIVAKSTTAGIGMDLLKQVPKIKFGPSAVTWQAFIEELSKSTIQFIPPDGTLNYQSALTMAISELGTFLDPSNREMVDMLVDLWDGQRGEWKKVTKTSGCDKIVNPWVNFIGCTTPAWISGAFPDYMIGGGFTSRAVFVYADQKRQYIPYPKQTIVPDDHAAMRADLLDDLKRISLMTGEYIMTPEAIDLGSEWYMDFHKKRPAHLDNEQFEGYIARKQTHIHKLAIVLSAACSDELSISAETLSMAIEIVTALEADMPKVFNKIGQSNHGKHAGMLLRIIKTHHKIKDQELYKLVYKNMSTDEFSNSLDALKKANLITIGKWTGGYEFSLKVI